MANLVEGGFRFWGTLSGGKGHVTSTFVSEVANNYGTQLSKNDVIIPVSDGTVAIGAADKNGLLMGVIIGCSRVIDGKRTPCDFIPANTTFTPTTVGSANASLVEWVPLNGDNIFLVNGDDATTATTIAANIALIGENCDIASPGSPSTVIGRSTMLLDVSTHATTTANFRIIGIPGSTTEGEKFTGIDWAATGVPFMVVCNEGFLPPYTATGV